MFFYKTTKHIENNENNVIDNKKELLFLVLTKSAKNHNFCVAGIDLNTKKIIRLVSNEKGDAISKYNFIFNGREINCLDVIKVRGYYHPLKIQTENFILNSITDYVWTATSLSIIKNFNLIDNGNILINNLPYSHSDDASLFKGSLMIVVVDNVTIYSTTNIQGQNKTKIDFTHKEMEYRDFRVTDFDYFALSHSVKMNKAIIVISTSETPYELDNNFYKFVAKIYDVSYFFRNNKPNVKNEYSKHHFQKGDIVVSDHFGRGTILSVGDEIATVLFSNGEAKIHIDYITKVS